MTRMGFETLTEHIMEISFYNLNYFMMELTYPTKSLH